MSFSAVFGIVLQYGFEFIIESTIIKARTEGDNFINYVLRMNIGGKIMAITGINNSGYTSYYATSYTKTAKKQIVKKIVQAQKKAM